MIGSGQELLEHIQSRRSPWWRRARIRADDLELLRRLAFFERRIADGGFAALMFDVAGDGLAEYEEMLIAVGAVGAERAQMFYVRAIRLVVANSDDLRAFPVDGPGTGGCDLHQALALLTGEYLSSGSSLAEETRGWRARIGALL